MSISEGEIADRETAGMILAQWRRTRRLSQLRLSLETGISTRHISFVENGRSTPSPMMVNSLCEALSVPARMRNRIYLAAGHAPPYRHTSLEAEGMVSALRAMRLILRGNEPFAAVAFDRNWDILMVNDAYRDWLRASLPADIAPYALTGGPRPNLLRLLVGDIGFRERLIDWPIVANAVLSRARKEIEHDPDPARRALFDEVFEQFNAMRQGLPRLKEPPLEPIMTIQALVNGRPVRLFNTLTTLGGAIDITLRELRIELFHPADDETKIFLGHPTD
ncbi:MAG: helix-turn-helix transcriptional regulator [Rhodospirillaceae bacterium]|jgi:transcriptional regulator with XRE-family HTH domain|nr:helix-turn-helix transcriptional regulator [Rhodospirillaceae bacterium]